MDSHSTLKSRTFSMRGGAPASFLVLFGLLLPAPGPAQQPPPIDQSRGLDARVDYRALTRYGPWDDRNYRLSAADLELLAPNEEELSDPIPAFFRVRMRRAWPQLRRSGPAQYPRSALQIFKLLYTGYQIEGRYYRRVVREDGRFRVLTDPSSEVESRTADRFLSGEVRVTSPVGAAESAVKINPVDPDRVIAGSNGPGGGQRMHYSVDGGASWQPAAALPLGNTCCDPTVDWKSDGSLAHTATLGNCVESGCAVWYYRSNDGGQTWNGLEAITPGDPRREITTTGSDKEYLHVDRHPSSPHRDNVYLTWHDNNVLQFARSTDDGHSWSKFGFASDPRGIGSDITTDRSGHVYYFWPDFDGRRIVLKKSTDGGASFAAGVTTVASTNASFTFPVPSMDTREVFVYVAAAADLTSGPYAGSLYVAWTDSTAATGANAAGNHARIRVARSRNGGASWSVVTPHQTADEQSVDRYHPWLAVGPDGTVHVAFYDTRRSAARTAVDLFYTASQDGGQTFSAPLRLTAQQSPKINDSFEFGDYNGLDAVMNDVIAVFTDNRNEGGGGGDSVDVYAAGMSHGDRPQVTITAPADGTTVAGGSELTFSGTATDPQDGDLTASLSWSSSLDGTIGSGGSFATTLSIGSHTVTASVDDAGGLTGSSSIGVTVETAANAPPTVTITSPADGASFAVGSSIPFAATASDPEDGLLTAGLAWSSSLDGAIGSGGSFAAVLSPGSHTVTAAVSDGGGQNGSDAVTVTVGCPGFEESFEGSGAGWSTGGLWHLANDIGCTSPGYSSPTRAMYFGSDASCTYATGSRASGDLVSPTVAGVTADSKLSFDYFRQVEETDFDPFETVEVAVSVEGSGSWTTLWSRTSLEPPENAWTGSGELSLAPFAGETVRLRFRFDSVDEIENGFVGWLVDDVRVSATCPDAEAIFADGFESGDLSQWSP